MRIDFNQMDSMTFPGMNNGTGTMTARMYNDDAYRIIPTAIHPGGSIGMGRYIMRSYTHENIDGLLNRKS